jgi:hypothetical protein
MEVTMTQSLINRSLRVGRIFLLFAAVCCLASHAIAGSDCSSRFSWLPYSDAASYRIYYGNDANGPYPYYVDIENPTTVNGRVYGEVSGLTCGSYFYFVCKAVDNSGSELAGSGEKAVITPIDSLRLVSN